MPRSRGIGSDLLKAGLHRGQPGLEVRRIAHASDTTRCPFVVGEQDRDVEREDLAAACRDSIGLVVPTTTRRGHSGAVVVASQLVVRSVTTSAQALRRPLPPRGHAISASGSKRLARTTSDRQSLSVTSKGRARRHAARQ